MNTDVSDYLATIGRVPLLTPAEEIELGNQVQAGQRLLQELADAEPSRAQARILKRAKRAKDRMVTANLRLVVHVAKRYQSNGIEMLDLVQEGSLGLMRAVELFDPTRGYKFSTYAFWWIRQAMQRCIDCKSRAIRVPIQVTELRRKVRRLIQERQHNGHNTSTITELAQALGEPESRIRDALELDRPMASLSSRNQVGGSELGDLLPCPQASPYEALEESERLDGLEKIVDMAMANMSEKQRETLVRRFALKGGEPETHTTIGRALGHCRERSRQLEIKALTKIRLCSVGVTELLSGG